MGINGAAFAAFGDIDGAFLASFGARKEGVKLGESTLKVFFMLLKSCYIVSHGSRSVVLTFRSREGCLPQTLLRG